MTTQTAVELTPPADPKSWSVEQWQAYSASLVSSLKVRDQQVVTLNAKNAKLSHELAILKRLKFAAQSEKFTSEQRQLFAETFDEDAAAVALEFSVPVSDMPEAVKAKAKPKRTALPAELPRTEIRHEPNSTTCTCGCTLHRMGEEVSEKLDYVPGTFTVERHIRGTWACRDCEAIVQAPMPAHVIDKGLATAGLIAHVGVSKFADHIPLYRQSGMFARAGLELSESTLGGWIGQTGEQLKPIVAAYKAWLLEQPVLHADETPMPMLWPDQERGKTHQAYLWAYASTQLSQAKAVIYDFCLGRGGRHAQSFLGDGWQGSLVCDDHAGYNRLFKQGITEAGCLAHARRKFYPLWQDHGSPIAKTALAYFAKLYEADHQAIHEPNSDAARYRPPDERLRLRQTHVKPIALQMHEWLNQQLLLLTPGNSTANAINYTLSRWKAHTRFIDDPHLPVDNNWVENQIRPLALGRKNYLFIGSQRAGERAAAWMTLIRSAKLNGHEPWAYMKDLLERLPTTKDKDIATLFPHNWKPL